MIYNILGRSNLKVSAISLGCEGFVGMEEDRAIALMDYAIRNGVNFIDMYTSNPGVRTMLGKALQGRRDQFVIQGHFCTVWEKGQYLRTRNINKVKAGFEEQLRLINTDYLDVGMIHYIDDMKDFRRVFDGEVMAYALEQKRLGRVRCLGLSTHNPEVGIEAVRSGLIDVILFSVNAAYDMQPATENVDELFDPQKYQGNHLNMDPQRQAFYEIAERENVGIDVMKVYGGGDLLSDQASPFGKAFTPVQAIHYALTRPGVKAVMVGVRSKEELDAALRWVDASDEEKDYSELMAGMTNFSWAGHCMYCGHCAPCTVGINIAYVNKLYNLTEAEGMIPETVREHYKSLEHKAGECIECGACETRCPFSVHIIDGMHRAAQRFGE